MSRSLTLPPIFFTPAGLAIRSCTDVATTPRARSCVTAVGRSFASISPETTAPPERPRYAYRAIVSPPNLPFGERRRGGARAGGRRRTLVREELKQFLDQGRPIQSVLLRDQVALHQI